jgi:hypothetical protein
MGGEGRALTPTLLLHRLYGLDTSPQSRNDLHMRTLVMLTPLFIDPLFPLRPPLIDMVVCVFSVDRRPATLETYQSASSRPSRGRFSLLYRIYVEIFGGRKFRENFEAQNPHPEIFPKFSTRTPKIL